MTVATRPREQATPVVARPAIGGQYDAARMLAITALCVAIYAAFIPQIVRYLSPLTGDEPFYVMTAISICLLYPSPSPRDS